MRSFNPNQPLDDAIDVYGNTFLHVGTIYEDYTLCSMLMLKGATPLITNHSGVTSFEIAWSLSNQSILQLFERHGYKLDQVRKQKREQLSEQRLTKIQLLRQQSKRKHLQSAYTFPKDKLHVYEAAHLGFAPEIENLIRLFPKIANRVDECKQSALMKAAYKGNIETLRLIINAQSDILEKDIYGFSALHWAILGNSPECVSILLNASSRNIQDAAFQNLTPLILAAYRGNTDILQTLVKYGANLKYRFGSKGISALEVACWMLNPEAALFLSRNNAQMMRLEPFLNGVSYLWINPFPKEITPQNVEKALTSSNLEAFRYIYSLILYPEKNTPVPSKLGLLTPYEEKLENYLNNQSLLIQELTRRIPAFGTTLDRILISVIKISFQLINATNMELKDQYIQITGNLLHHVSELTDSVERIEKLPKLEDALTNSTHDIIFSCVFQKVSPRVKKLNIELSKKLLIHTRLAMGVWPTPKSVLEIKRICGAISRQSCDLVHIVHATGYLSDLSRLELNLGDFIIDTMTGDEITMMKDQMPEPDVSRTLTFQDYKKKHEMDIMRELTKLSRQPNKNSENEEWNLVSKNTLLSFHNNLDSAISPFVSAVHELKNSMANFTKEQYVSCSSSILARIETILSEIEQYAPFTELLENVHVEDEDYDALALVQRSTTIPIKKEELPFAFAPMLTEAIKFLRLSAQAIVFQATVSSDPRVSNSASMDMLRATIPCCLNLKFLINFTKHMSEKIWKDSTEERRMREMWRRKCLQSEKVKGMFKLWEIQLKMGNKEEFVYDDMQLEILKESDEGLVYEAIQGTHPKRIKGGKLAKLIEMMTSILYQDPELNACLLMSHHSFSTSIEFIDALLKRYEITPPFGLNQKHFDVFVSKKILPVRIKVCEIIQSWIEQYHQEDFVSNPTLVKKVLLFIDQRLLIDFDNLAEKIFTLIQDNVYRNQYKEQSIKYPVILAPATDAELNFMDIDPKLLAKQLTLIEHDLLTKVKVYECTDQIWGEKRKKELSKIEGGKFKSKTVGISLMISHTNQLTMWIASKILASDNIKTRVSCIRYITAVASHCRELGNYNAITAISAAMSVAPIGRLYNTWAMFEKNYPKIKEELTMLSDLVSPKGQYANYRKVLKDLPTPAIPFLGVYLTDMTFLELGNSDFLPESSYINVEKRRKVYQIIKEIEKFQLAPYKFEEEGKIKLMYHYWETGVLEENALYDKSLLFEPRKEEEEDDL